MAWNPSPEVAAVREAAKVMAQSAGVAVTKCVVIYETEDGRIGYASYGANKNLCASAKAWADGLLAYSEDTPED